MNSKNLSASDLAHMGWVKEQPCSCCGAEGPSLAHHIEQGLHFATIPLCEDCHVGSHNGIHRNKHIWKVLKKTEISCLNDTIRRLANGGR